MEPRRSRRSGTGSDRVRSLVLRRVFGSRGGRLATLAWGSSATAEGAYLVVLGVVAYRAGGAAALGLAGLVRMLPAAVAASFGTLLVDRLPRERVLRLGEATRTAMLAGAACAVVAGAPTVLLFLFAGVHALASGVTRPSYRSLLPALARTPEELVAANPAFATLEGFGLLVGPALAGVLVTSAGAGVGFAVAAACCLLSSALVAAVRVEGGALRIATSAGSGRDMLAGFRAVAGSDGARLIVGLFAAQTFVRGALTVLTVVVALHVLGLGQAWVGFLSAALGGGGIVSALAAPGLARRQLAAPFLAGLVLWGLPIALIAAVPSAAMALVAFALVGAGNALLDTAGNTLLQRTVPVEVLGRVFGARCDRCAAPVARAGHSDAAAPDRSRLWSVRTDARTRARRTHVRPAVPGGHRAGRLPARAVRSR
jgi:MFS family permease